MKPGFFLAPSAARDLADIFQYILDQSGPVQAVHVVGRFFEEFSNLARTPGLGRIRADIPDATLRVWSVFSWLIVYRFETQPVDVVRIIHGARDVAQQFRGPES